MSKRTLLVVLLLVVSTSAAFAQAPLTRRERRMQNQRYPAAQQQPAASATAAESANVLRRGSPNFTARASSTPTPLPANCPALDAPTEGRELACTAKIPSVWQDQCPHAQHELNAAIQGLIAAAQRSTVSGLDIEHCDLPRNFQNTHITQSKFVGDDLTKADFTGAHLTKVVFDSTVMDNADFTDAVVQQTNFIRTTSLKSAVLGAKSLRGTLFAEQADLTDADFSGANLYGLRLESWKLPDPASLARARNLESWASSPTTDQWSTIALYRLEQIFLDNGMEYKAKVLNAALQNEEQNRLAHQCMSGDWRNSERGYMTDQIGACTLGALRLVTLKLPSDYGLHTWRPLFLLFALMVIFAVIYYVILLVRRPSGIVVHQGSDEDEDAGGPGTEAAKREDEDASSFGVLRKLRVAVVLSLRNAFNLSFGEVDVGRWIRLLSLQSYELRTTGAVRLLGGIQSLLSLYLFALWLLNFFGKSISGG
jgi:uncharacterized protein YjbI with pentapeptide repeats